MWPSIDTAVRDLVIGIVQPLLNKFKPKNFARLDIATLTLGTVAPRVCSAKALGASTASGAMLDLEIKWASDLQLTLEVPSLHHPSRVLL